MLSGQVILVTGASSGIGQELVLALAKYNVKIVIVARRKRRLEDLAEKIVAEGSEVLVVPADLTKTAQISHLVQSTVKKFGRIDVLVNMGGWGVYKWFEDFSYKEIENQFHVNVLGMAELTRQVIPHMKRFRSGHIINMSSYASKIVFPPLTVYSATKYAVEGLTDGLRRELGPWGISVSRVHPSGVIGTEFNRKSEKRGGIDYTSPKIGKISKKFVAEKIIKLIEHPKPALFLGRIYDIPVLVNLIFPKLIDLIAFWWVRKMRKTLIDAK